MSPPMHQSVNRRGFLGAMAALGAAVGAFGWSATRADAASSTAPSGPETFGFVLPSAGPDADIVAAQLCSTGVNPMLNQMPSSNAQSMPTVVLVHGAFADASSWNGVIERLQANGIRVTATANPLRGVSIDSAYLASVFNQIPGPVVAVAHSYGGVVISNAASMASNVVGLVYVAAYAPDEGERLTDLAPTSKDTLLGPTLVTHQYPTGPGGESAVEVTVDPAKFHDVFAADLPMEQAALLAATQRPFAELSLTEPSGRPAWKSLPSWAVVATADKVIGTDLVRSHAERARATITDVDASHVVMISHPQAVTDVILGAVAKIGLAEVDRTKAVA